jgi:hypothetical protein
VIPLGGVLVLCTHWEPVMRDGWGHVVWLRNHARPGGPGFADFLRECYLQENPRLGQIPTLVSYVRGPYHAIVTPLAELGVLGLLTTIALGRWPSPRRSDDALAAALVTAIVFACVPQIGPMLFYRPFTWNYVFGLGLNLGWLVPYRLALARDTADAEPGPARPWFAAGLFVLGIAAGLFVLGIAAGLCNEHTGPAFLAMGALATAVAWRRGGLRPWMIAGLVGLAAGYAVLLTAPAQHVRYGALAQQAGIVARIVDRGALGNLAVLGGLALALVPVLPLVVIGLVAPRAARSPAADHGSPAGLVLAGVLCTLTLLASPKLGPRLYFASVALIAAGLTGWLIGRLTARWARRACAVLAAGALGFVAVRLVAIHRAEGPLGAARLDLVEHGQIGSVVTVPGFSSGVSRYFLGDDLLVPAARDVLAREYGLAGIELAPAGPGSRP